jgi:NCS1 family nucleobase:cation symporter-1
MVPIGGVYLGVLALVFVALANISSTAVSLFATGLALRHVPALRARPWHQLMLLTIVPCLPFVFWPAALYDLGDAFLAYNGTMYAPIVGIVFVDYFFLRGQRLSLWSIFDDDPSGDYYYSRGFNWLALGSVILGQVVYVTLYNPITGETHDWFRFMPASVAACIVPALTYGIGSAIRGTARPRPAHHGIISPNI